MPMRTTVTAEIAETAEPPLSMRLFNVRPQSNPPSSDKTKTVLQGDPISSFPGPPAL